MLTPPVSARDHATGGDHPLVTLVEYGDFECPVCGRAYPIVQDTVRSLWENVRFVFRHFPIAQAHPHSVTAAQAAEAAGVQGRFWPMHDILFEHQDAFEDEDLIRYAGEAGIDLERFITELQDDAHLARVQSDFRSGVRSGVHGTPTFFVDGRQFDGNWADGDLALSLMASIRSKKSGPAAGVAEPG